MKVIPNAWGENAVLKLMFAALVRASEKWRLIPVTGFERQQMEHVRKELDEEYRADNQPVSSRKTEPRPAGIPSKNRT